MTEDAGFFVDSCVLLPQSLQSTQKACSEFLNNRKRFFISASVKNEAFELTKVASSVVRTSIRDYLKPALTRAQVKEITNKSGIAVAIAFSQEKGRLNKEVPTTTGVRSELIGIVENFLAHQIHSMKDGESATVDDLLAKALTEMEEARYKIEKPFKTAELIVIQPDKDLINLKPLVQLVHNVKDTPHLAAAIQNQFVFNQWVIFVTNDEKEIILNQEKIWDTFALQCTKPCWALDYYNQILKLRNPIQFYQDKWVLTEEQKEFGTVFRRLTGIKILRDQLKT
jgi:hypothetical protein